MRDPVAFVKAQDALRSGKATMDTLTYKPYDTWERQILQDVVQTEALRRKKQATLARRKALGYPTTDQPPASYQPSASFKNFMDDLVARAKKGHTLPVNRPYFPPYHPFGARAVRQGLVKLERLYSGPRSATSYLRLTPKGLAKYGVAPHD